jgi:2',3'-cyclic-nucleotide 2'-phosphodiesterase
LRILFIADIFARPGRRAVAWRLPSLIRERQVDLVIANGENAAGGFGLTANIVRKLHHYGVDVITSGNHVWDRQDFPGYLQRTDRVLRPLNYPVEVAGAGSVIVPARSGLPVGVINLQGRTGMPSIDCPFRAGRREAERLRDTTPIVFVDFHAEATAEKMALGWHLDGLASAVIGTHTHVQTADARILPGGTAYLTDAGMTGPHDSVIGVRPEIAIQRFLTQVPLRFKPADRNLKFCGVLVAVEPGNGKALSIEALQIDVTPAAGDGEEEE